MENIVYVKTPYEVSEAMDYLKGKKVLGFDTETNGLDPLVNDVLLIQLGDAYKQFVFDVYRIENSIMEILGILSDPGVMKIAHNAKFDYAMIKGYTNVMCHNMGCTFVGASLLTGGVLNVSNSLEACLDKYLGIKADKVKQKSFVGMPLGSEFTEGQIKYAGKDVEHMIPLHRKIKGILDERGMDTLYEMEREAVRVCGDMELNGIYLDKNRWKKITLAAVKARDEAIEELHGYFREVCQVDMFNVPVVNYASPVQVKPLLEKITGQTIEKTEADVLKKIKHPVIKPFLNFKKQDKIVSTYGDKFVRENIHRVTGRVHSSFKQLGAGTGRMASRDPKHVGVFKLGELSGNPPKNIGAISSQAIDHSMDGSETSRGKTGSLNNYIQRPVTCLYDMLVI